jgi:nucleoside-diphosphate kinase
MEQTLVLIKPDGVKRHLIGEIIRRFEEAGLTVQKLQMLSATEELLVKHYVEEEGYLRSIGEKAAANGVQVDDTVEYGRGIVMGLRKYLTEGPIVAMVLEGEEGAVALTRKVVGATNPPRAEEGTIRRDLGEDSFDQANAENRPVKNLIHASGTVDEALSEIQIWFPS